MKTNILTKSILLAMLFLTTLSAKSQVNVEDSVFARILESDVLIPRLLDSTRLHNPTVRRGNSQIDMLKEVEKGNKYTILNAISFVSSYYYGNSADLSSVKDASGVTTPSSFRAATSDRFNVGVSLQVPLSNLLSRKNILRTANLQVKMAEEERDGHALYIEQEVIRQYQELKLAYKLLKASGSNKQSTLATHTMAQKEFLQGNATIDLLSRMYDIYSKAAMEHEIYVSRFQASFLQLQLLIGSSLTDLINSVK